MWRYDPAGLFSARCWGIPYIGFIPDLPKKTRRDEILAWLKTHPRVKRFAVLDDEDDELDELPLFQPLASTGLTREIAAGLAHYHAGAPNSGCGGVKVFLPQGQAARYRDRKQVGAVRDRRRGRPAAMIRRPRPRAAARSPAVPSASRP